MSMSPTSVLVTGANRGLGLEFIKQLVKLRTPPANVFAACRSPDSAKELQELAKEYKRVYIIKIDHNDLSSLDETVQSVERLSPQGLNLLINNAGKGGFQESIDEDVTSEKMVQLFQVNAVGPLMVAKAFLPLLRQAASGTLDINTAAIVNISTGLASLAENDTGKGYAYRTSKAALNMITKNLSLDLRKDNILVNALHPGWVKTELGGPRATMEVTDSVKTMLDLMASWRGEKYHGQFYHYSGREMAW